MLVPNVEQIDDGYALCDVETLQLIYTNHKFCEWFHISAKTLPHLTEIIDGLDNTKVLKRLKRRGYYAFSYENNEASAGTPILINLSFKILTWQDNIYIAIHAHDYSMLKEKEALIQSHSKMLEKSNRELIKKTKQLEYKNEQLSALSSKLGKYLSPQVYNSIFTGENQVKVETYRKKLTIFFSDIQGFTELTDSIEPELLSGILNTYLQEMSDIAHKYGGTVDKFIGDGILIFFGDPNSKGEKEDALACVLMAMEMRSRMRDLREHWQDQGVPRDLYIRMGINSGFCTVGNFGSEKRMEYTVVGGQVNVASRLETIAEPDEIIISYQTYNLLDEKVRCLNKGEVELKGLARPVQIYRVIEYNHDHSQTVQVEISEEFEGFSFSLDLQRVDKAKTLATLRRMISQIELEQLKPMPKEG